jgi:hypothetical protein
MKLNPTPTAELEKYTVIDDVIVPPEYERYIIVQWGDRVYPNPDDYFGFNNDHTGYVPIHGTHDGFLVITTSTPRTRFTSSVRRRTPGSGTAIPGRGTGRSRSRSAASCCRASRTSST